MAQRLATYIPKHRGRPAKVYPWKDWLDGSYWRLTKDKDFESKVNVMSQCIRNAAIKYRKKVSVYIENPNSLVLKVHL